LFCNIRQEYLPLVQPLSTPTITRTELLAPAGGPDAGYAALHYGADAVYLGLKRFSARSEAENFTVNELEAFTAFAHALVPRRNVYVTINTLVRDEETGDAAGLLYDCAAAGADAVIVQDLGIANIARLSYPGLHLHASTQMAIHSKDGVIALRQAGFSRVNMARELTIDELRECASVPGIEIEAFVHGALCYSYSGLCLYSSLLRGRSGNRGGCAYPCRDRFRTDGQPNDEGLFAFSMKDLALPSQIAALCKAGVASLKIEGRKKSPLYVATVTSLYRRILDGDAGTDELKEIAEDVKTVFSRPWTTLFSGGRRSQDTVDDQTVGHRGAPIGNVVSVRRTGSESRLRFIPSRPLERHDGVQVDVDGEDKPFGFSTLSLYEIGPDGIARSVFKTEAGATVEVALPPDAPALAPGAPVYCASSQKTKREYPFHRPGTGIGGSSFQLDAVIRILQDRITVDAKALDLNRTEIAGVQASIEGSFTKAQNPGHSENAARDAFSKLGDTPFSPGVFRVENPDALFAPISLLNKLRRNLTLKLAEEAFRIRKEQRDALVLSYTPEPRQRPRQEMDDRERWAIAIDRAESLASFNAGDLTGVDEVIYRLNSGNCNQAMSELRSVRDKVGSGNIRLGLPMIIRDNERDDTIRAITDAQILGIYRWEVNGLGGRQLLDTVVTGSPDISAGWPLYVLNRESVSWLIAQGYSGVTASPEDSMRNIGALLSQFGNRVTLPVYLDPPLFIAESCASARFLGECTGEARCKAVERPLRSSGNENVVLCRDRCRTIVLSHAPFSRIAQMPEYRETGARSFLAEFTYRVWKATDTSRIWREVRAGETPDFSVPHPQKQMR
jgi:putative protease